MTNPDFDELCAELTARTEAGLPTFTRLLPAHFWPLLSPDAEKLRNADGRITYVIGQGWEVGATVRKRRRVIAAIGHENIRGGAERTNL